MTITNTEMDAQLAQARASRDNAIREMHQFKATVREWLIENADDFGLDREDLNEQLDNLGLEKVVRRYSVSVRVEATLTVELAEGTEVDDHIEEYLSGELEDNVSIDLSNVYSDDDWEIDYVDAAEVYDVQEAD